MNRLSLLAVALLLCGCAPPADRASIVLRGPRTRAAPAGAVRPNLALGASAEHLQIARGLTYRSGWPATTTGYWFDDLSYFSDVQSDEQYQFDKFGAFYRLTDSVRSGVVVR